MVRPRYGRSVKGLGLGFRIENRQGQGHEQLEAVEDRLGAVIAERLQRRERHLFGYNSHPFGPMAVPTPSLYKYRALDPEFDTEFLRGTSAKIVRDKPQKEKREPAIRGENQREAWLFQETPDRGKQGLRRWIPDRETERRTKRRRWRLGRERLRSVVWAASDRPETADDPIGLVAGLLCAYIYSLYLFRFACPMRLLCSFVLFIQGRLNKALAGSVSKSLAFGRTFHGRIWMF